MAAKVVWDEERFEEEVNRRTKRMLRSAGEELRNLVKRNISAGRPASKPGDFPHADTGRLRNSIFWEFVSDYTVIVGTPLKHGLWMEIGANPVPRNTKAMAIPISREAKRHSQAGNSPRTFPKPLVMIRRPGGTPLLIEETKGRGKTRTGARSVIHYVLSARVRIVPRPYLRPSLEQLKGRLTEILGQ